MTHKLFEKFDRLIILQVGSTGGREISNVSDPDVFVFDPKNDIWDMKSLYKQLKVLSTSERSEQSEYLTSELGGEIRPESADESKRKQFVWLMDKIERKLQENVIDNFSALNLLWQSNDFANKAQAYLPTDMPFWTRAPCRMVKRADNMLHEDRHGPANGDYEFMVVRPRAVKPVRLDDCSGALEQSGDNLFPEANLSYQMAFP